MKKIKQVFPSRNYITVDSYGDVEVVFNPVGDGFEGDDKLMFRKGRWAFRVNDFLSGKVMADGSKEGMGRKVYSLNLVYDDEDGEPVVNTTYVDPTSVIPLDGSVVDVVGSEKLAQEKTLQTVAKEATLQDVQYGVNVLRSKIDLRATSAKQDEIKTVLTSDIYNKIGAVENSVDSVGSTLDNLFDDDSGYAMRSQIKLILDRLIDEDETSVADDVNYVLRAVTSLRMEIGKHNRSAIVLSLGANQYYSAGTVFYFGTNRFISLRSDCITILVGSEFLLLGDISEYNNGTVKRLDGVKFAQSDVTKIVS